MHCQKKNQVPDHNNSYMITSCILSKYTSSDKNPRSPNEVNGLLAKAYLPEELFWTQYLLSVETFVGHLIKCFGTMSNSLTPYQRKGFTSCVFIVNRVSTKWGIWFRVTMNDPSCIAKISIPPRAAGVTISKHNQTIWY